jgi:TolB-like protein/class 3 adenylate cyclase/Flp pilus assembly protein TadD
MTEQEAKPKRRLAAIMATDVVGYSKLMQSDEASALAALAAIRRAAQEHIELHQGRIANTAGDSILAEFGSAVEAVDCALALQQQLSSRTESEDVQVRIGIHLGDVVDKGGDLFGTAVNVAARLEGIAQPGGIAVSAAVRDAIARKLAASFADLGLKTLKNIEEPIRAYALSSKRGLLLSGAPSAEQSLPLPNKPSIAILAFDNLSGDRDQEYFADGIVEEIITALSRFRGLFVIARNSSFAYKGRSVDVKQVGRELGVRYILEGSVRKAGSRVRITGQLIDSATGAHLWAERFDGVLEDIFDLQDQVTASVVGAISQKLEQAEIERTRRKTTDNLDAYDYFLRGLAGFHQWTKEGNEEALAHLYRAIELDPNFALAYGMAARCYAQRKGSGWTKDSLYDVTEAERLARRAVAMSKDDAVVLCTAGFALAHVVEDIEYGDALITQALALNPNLAWAWLFSGWVKISLGEPEVAIEHITRAMRLNPNDPQKFSVFAALGLAHFIANRYTQALAFAQAAASESPEFIHPMCIAAASAALTGRSEVADKAINKLRHLAPALRLSNLKTLQAFRRPEDFARWEEGLRLAGLPE